MNVNVTFRQFFALLAVPLVLSACDRQPTGIEASESETFEAVLESSGEGASAGMFLQRAPEAVRLSAEQRRAIREINEAFRAANQADFRALEAITRSAIAARRAGATPAELRAILEDARPIRERLGPAFQELRREIHAVLTEAQREWLKNNARRFGPQLPSPPRRP